MEYLQNHDTFALWLQQYGSIMLFTLLCLGIVAFPVPEETLMVLSGVLMNQGHLEILPTLLAAYTGSMSGITISYGIGRMADKYVIKKYGGWAGLDAKKWDQIHAHFKRYGTWMLFFGYFIPGVRHFTGFATGIIRLKWQQFAPFAYSGACVWVSTFLSIGYFGGEGWHQLEETAKYTIIDVAATIVVLLALYAIIKQWIKT
ncbi:MAG TPA: DedA family protein [Chlamydiales bacterium]|nr:DedA family protein [Chlamydiales bacterium]